MNDSGPSDQEKARYEATVRALEFELDQFWKRSIFFWGFIGAAFVAFSTASGQLLIQGTIASFGFICSTTWTLANRGSKFWYESWELERREAEKPITGVLYGRWHRKKSNGFGWLAGERYSPSKLTIALSDYVVALWLGLLLSRAYLVWRNIHCSVTWKHSVDLAVLSLWALSTVYAAIIVPGLCRSNDGRDETTDEHEPPPSTLRSDGMSDSTTTQAIYAADCDLLVYHDKQMWSRFQTVAAIEAATLYGRYQIASLTLAEKAVFTILGALLVVLACLLTFTDRVASKAHLERIRRIEQEASKSNAELRFEYVKPRSLQAPAFLAIVMTLLTGANAFVIIRLFCA
jgi:hypothetical protein